MRSPRFPFAAFAASLLALLSGVGPATAALIFHATMDNADVGAGSGTDTSLTAAFQVRDSVNANHGTAGNAQTLGATVTNHMTSGEAGQMGQSLQFDTAGVADNRGVNFGDVNDVGAGSFTVSLWINTTLTTGTQMIASKGNSSSTAAGWSIFLENGVIYTRAGVSSTNRGSQQHAFTDLNSWHMITMTLDSGTGTILGYLDGSATGWTSGGGGPPAGDNLLTAGTNLDNANPLALGIRSSDFGVEFRGYLDDVAIWDSALTPAEISQIYTNGLNGIGVPEPSAAGLLAAAAAVAAVATRRRRRNS